MNNRGVCHLEGGYKAPHAYSAQNPILNMLRWYKGCCVVAGYGVISTGDATLEQAAHNASSAERIARFRQEAYINHKLLNGPPPNYFEPQ